MWNKICLWLSVFFLSRVNIFKANKEAHWDDAQNYIENRCKLPNTSKAMARFRKMSYTLETLHKRTQERAEDFWIESDPCPQK